MPTLAQCFPTLVRCDPERATQLVDFSSPTAITALTVLVLDVIDGVWKTEGEGAMENVANSLASVLHLKFGA